MPSTVPLTTKKPSPFSARSVATPVFASVPWVNICWISPTRTPEPGSEAEVPARIE